MFSLMSALGASLAKGWVTQFSSSVSGSSWGDAALHCRRFRGLKRWRLKLIVESLPIYIHIAFFLFSIGLIVLLFQDDTGIGAVMLVLTALIGFLYLLSSVHPTYSSDSPFRTPVSGLISQLLRRSWRLDAFGPFPIRTDAQKAQALAWLLVESPNRDTVIGAIRAIAGLPANPAVQDELLHGPTVALLVRTLSAEFAKPLPDPELLSSCLYAIFHLVQTAPAAADAEDKASLLLLRALVSPGGELAATDSMQAGIHEIALCVNARIWFFLLRGVPENTLIDTEMPVLLKSCVDGHLRRLLFEIHLLSAHPGKTGDASRYDFLERLRIPNAVDREEVHTELTKAATSGMYTLIIRWVELIVGELGTFLSDTVATYGARTLLEGLTTGSTELRRRYAGVFEALAAHGAWIPGFQLLVLTHNQPHSGTI
jgi:hypothetical protein